MLSWRVSIVARIAVIVLSLTGVVTVNDTRPAGAATTSSKIVAIYGDSIMFESAGVVAKNLASHKGWKEAMSSFPGSAPCDWLAQLKSDLTQLHPGVVVLETMGNDATTCMTRVTGSRGSRAYYNEYRSNFDTYFGDATKAGAKVVFIQPIPVLSSRFNGVLEHLTEIAKTEAAKYPDVSISSAPRDAVTVSGRFVMKKACLPRETVAMGCNKTTREIIVRAPDHVHLCPTGYPAPYSFFTGCSVYSSGAVRHGSAVVDTAISPPRPIRP
jgi:hypothetical protein